MGRYYIHYQQMEASRACIMKAELRQIQGVFEKSVIILKAYINLNLMF
jgi:hypothetical protein